MPLGGYHVPAEVNMNGFDDGLLTPNLYYKAMGRSLPERQEAYRRFVAIEEPYRALLDELLMKT